MKKNLFAIAHIAIVCYARIQMVAKDTALQLMQPVGELAHELGCQVRQLKQEAAQELLPVITKAAELKAEAVQADRALSQHAFGEWKRGYRGEAEVVHFEAKA